MLSITYISTVCIVCLTPPHYNANANASGNYLIGWDSSGLRWLAKCLQTLPKRSRLILLTPSDFHLHKLSRAMWLPVTRFCEILPHSINSLLIFIQICSQPTNFVVSKWHISWIQLNSFLKVDWYSWLHFLKLPWFTDSTNGTHLSALIHGKAGEWIEF